jgi:hypothetical protein
MNLVILPVRSHLVAHVPGEYRAGFTVRHRRVGRCRRSQLISLSSGRDPICGLLAGR